MDSHRVIPIFPLPLVQFPGAITPLHIFEPRYRKMIKDVMAADKTFGILYRSDQLLTASEALPAGSIGCTVEVAVVQELPDGQSNILCVGSSRYRVAAYVEGEPYQRAEVEFFDDDISFDDLSAEVARAKELFERLLIVNRKLKIDNGPDDEQMPDLPDDPQILSFIIAAYLDIEADDKQELLEMVETGKRLREVNRMLKELAEDFEKRILANQLSKKNGHAGRMPKFE
ncbi:MAG: LON peptidase substrate-binding domain-containing protein [Acidobacteriota bacterium]|nr:LON peptidase substrate-binding domain-containing protein [Acidobacteriota bacterium]